MKKLLCAVALLCAYAGAQTVNPNQIRPGTQDGMILETVTANQPPTWQQIGVRLTLQHNSTNVTDQTLFNAVDDGTIAPDSGYTLAKWLTNSTGGWAAEVPTSNLQNYIPPPIAGQSVFVPFTVATNSGLDTHCRATSDPTSGKITMDGGSNLGCQSGPGPTITWSAATLPSYVEPANVTAVYAVGTIGYTGSAQHMVLTCADGTGNLTTLMDGGTAGGSDTGVLKPYDAHLTWATGSAIGSVSCEANMAANSGGATNPVVMNIPSVGLLLFYNGPAPPVNNAIDLTAPLYFNPSLNSMGVAAINLGCTTGADGCVTGTLPYTSLPALTANQLLGALTSTTPSGLDMPSCSGAANALIWTTGTGFGCSTVGLFQGVATADVVVVGPSSQATSGANLNSPHLVIGGSYWNGTNAAANVWTFQDVLGSGTNPSSTLAISHSGSTGPAAIAMPPIVPGTLYSAAGTPLPTCGATSQGEQATVSDATSPTYMGAYTSGGTITTAVICSYDGTTYAWKTH